jgi:signal transduction histidine kinase
MIKQQHINRFILAIVVLFTNTTIAFSQETDFTQIVATLGENDFISVKSSLSTIDTTAINLYDKATWLYYFSEYNYKIDKHHIAYENIVKSKKLFNTLNKDKDVADCNILLVAILSHQNLIKINSQPVIDELTRYAKEKKDTVKLMRVYHELAVKFLSLGNLQESIKYFKKNINLSILNKDSLRMAHDFMNIGTVYNNPSSKHKDSALYYTKKAIPILNKYHDNQNLSYNYNNLGNSYKKAGDFQKAIIYFKKANAIPLEKFVTKSKIIYCNNLADAYYKNKEYQNAAIYFQKLKVLQDSIDDTQQNIAISKIKEKYDNEKLRADNLVSEAKRIKNRNLLFTTLAILFFSLITGFLIYKNIIRKKRIIEKEKQLQQQKVTNLLKEQELIAIDAMIEGQEKERQLIASDLHDDLGALMATLQLNFENLDKHKNSKNADALFTKTKILIREAYQKIRKIAHAKNSGVIAKQGLLKAIENNAAKISQLNSIEIEVREYGLENRLENSLELMIFRIIQELITNIIKHAEATEVTIHFTNHEDLLNIMVEDNGKGFNTTLISKSNGMGIHSIEKRIESIEGTMTIESIIGKGTTVILDIPL